jgi:flagellar hook assembly protein FlgD
VTHVVPARAPNSTRVNAGLVGLDLSSGGASAGASERAFSPNGDGSRDTMRLRWTNTVALDSLRLRVFKPNGTFLGGENVSALAAGDRSWDWNGRLDGARVDDGRYVLQLVGSADGRTFSAPSVRPTTPAQVSRYAVTVDTVAPSLTSASASERLISPNGDGFLDRTRLALDASGATRWTIRVNNAGGTAVRSSGGAGGSGALSWAGTTDAGTRVPDGRYTATLAAWDAAGNPATRTLGITVDTKGPASTPAAAPTLFSPNGDGAADTTRLSWTANEPGTGWVRIYKGDTRIRTWSVDDAASWAATWNGRRADGSRATDGRYTLRVSLRDAAGNPRTTSAPVVVDRTAGSLAWSRHFYPQDGDALRADAAVSWRLTRDATTTLRVYDAGGTLVRTAWTQRDQAAGDRSWTWNGRDGDGRTVPQGAYTARLTVVSPLGTSVLQRGVLAGAFRVTANATRVGPGDTLVIRFSTVEPLSSRPVATFNQPGLKAAQLTATRLDDGTYKASFTVGAGDPGGGSVRISATDTGGAVNATTLSITVTR